MTMQDGFNFAVGAFAGVGVSLMIGAALLALGAAALRIINRTLTKMIGRGEQKK